MKVETKPIAPEIIKSEQRIIENSEEIFKLLELDPNEKIIKIGQSKIDTAEQPPKMWAVLLVKTEDNTYKIIKTMFDVRTNNGGVKLLKKTSKLFFSEIDDWNENEAKKIFSEKLAEINN